MDNLPDVPSVVVILATVAGGIVGVLTKYLLDRHKLKADIAENLWKHIYERLEQLEKENKDCTKLTAEMSKNIGFLEARCEILEKCAACVDPANEKKQ